MASKQLRRWCFWELVGRTEIHDIMVALKARALSETLWMHWIDPVVITEPTILFPPLIFLVEIVWRVRSVIE